MQKINVRLFRPLKKTKIDQANKMNHIATRQYVVASIVVCRSLILTENFNITLNSGLIQLLNDQTKEILLTCPNAANVSAVTESQR